MIVPMKKATLLCLAHDRAATLDALRNLGVLHVKPVVPPAGAGLEDAREKAAGLRRLLDAIPGVACPTPEGAFYVYPSVKGLLGSTLRGNRIESSSQLAGIILDEAEVAVVPGEAFGTPGYLRLSYATSDADITEGVGRMASLLGEAQ